MNSSPSCADAFAAWAESGWISMRKGSMCRPALLAAREKKSRSLWDGLSLPEKRTTRSCAPTRETTGPTFSSSSRKVPRRTPSARAIRIRGLRDGMSAPDSICATSSGARSARSASCSSVMLRDSRIERTFSPRLCVTAMSHLLLSVARIARLVKETVGSVPLPQEGRDEEPDAVGDPRLGEPDHHHLQSAPPPGAARHHDFRGADGEVGEGADDEGDDQRREPAGE